MTIDWNNNIYQEMYIKLLKLLLLKENFKFDT